MPLSIGEGLADSSKHQISKLTDANMERNPDISLSARKVSQLLSVQSDIGGSTHTENVVKALQEEVDGSLIQLYEGLMFQRN